MGKIKPKPIRFGLIRNSVHLFAWQEMVVKKLIEEAHIELTLVVSQWEPDPKAHWAPSSPQASARSGFLWDLYDRHLIKKISKALQLVATDSLFAGVPEIRCHFIDDNYGGAQLEDTDIEKLGNTNLDFIINFSSIRLTGHAVNTARYGIWSFLFGNAGKYRGSIPCFWEIYNEDGLTSAFLVRPMGGPGAAVVLKEGHLKTRISYPNNIDKIHFECGSWPLKICQDIRNKNTDYLTVSSEIKVDPCRFPPDNRQFLIFLLIQVKLLVKKACKMLFYVDYWNIGVANAPIHEFLNPKKKPSVKWFPNLPKIRFMADPFGITLKGKLYILYEDFRFDQGSGKTASLLFDKGKFLENNIVIDEEFHMSYPFLVEHGGETYCIPETYQANQVRLYKAVAFPTKWRLEKILIDNYAGVDSSLFEYKGTWFLFSTDKNAGHRYNLNIHWSESLFGPWEAHPKNPVKTDIRSARPAGTLFEHKGSVYRPAMDYSQKVEGRIVINRILALTKQDFKEEARHSIDPFKNIYFSDKVHTLSRVGAHTLVDGAKELFIFSNFHAFKYKIMRIIAEFRN